VNAHHGDEAGTPRTMGKPPSWRAKCRCGFMTLSAALLKEQPAVVLSLERA
jgi:hypothetical protein